jgi:deazaflavin-dependent oxidoreductase (nitroreductase family)
MHYRAPSWFDRNVMNPVIAALTRLGLSFAGSRILEVPGRTSGRPRRNPVNPLTLGGLQYLVAPRGHTQWVRNLRAAGQATLLLGARRQRFLAVELADDEKEAVLRAYLRKWGWESARFFDGVGPDSDSAEFAQIAPRHPVFRIAKLS